MNNILDLLITNNEKLICHQKAEHHKKLSDHNLIEINIPGCELLPETKLQRISSSTIPKLHGFRGLDLNKADFVSISSELSNIDWDSLFNITGLKEFPKAFQQLVLGICQKHTPLKGLKRVIIKQVINTLTMHFFGRKGY